MQTPGRVASPVSSGGAMEVEALARPSEKALALAPTSEKVQALAQAAAKALVVEQGQSGLRGAGMDPEVRCDPHVAQRRAVFS